jgi:hypothetical protein
MKRAYLVCLFCLTTTFLLSQSNSVTSINQNAGVVSPIAASQADQKAQAKILDSYGQLPLSFEANHGQTDGRVKFLSRTGGYTLFLTGDEAVLAWSGKNAKKTSPQRLKPASLALAGPGGTAKPATAKSAAGEPAVGEPRFVPGEPVVGEPRFVSGEPAVGEPRFVSGYRFSDTASSPKLDAPLGAGQRPSTLSADPEVVATGGVLRMKLRDANPAARVSGQDELAGTSNYFIGNDPAKWRSSVPTFAKVKYEGIYPGIDLVYYGNHRQLEYDFIVAPGADPRRIEFDVRGAKRIRRDEHGDLVLKMKMGEGEIRWHKPVVYQEKDGTREEIAANYSITDPNRVGFAVAEYDTSRPLYIDPLIYSTYLGGSEGDAASGIAVDSAGNAYVTGTTGSTNFPTVNPVQSANAGLSNVFVAKINPTGSALVYSTYLGGSYFDNGYGIAVDSAGNAYVTGVTTSNNFPTTPGAFQTICNGGSNCGLYGDAFVAKIDPEGSALVYSTYLGGSLGGGGNDRGTGIAVDSTGHAYVTGFTDSTDFPTKNPLQPVISNPSGNVPPAFDAFVTKINAAGSALVYSTYLGGSQEELGNGIAVDGAGRAYVTGLTCSTDFPTMSPLQPANAGGCDAFVAKISAGGSALVYSTYLGGKGTDSGNSIAVDSSNNAYVIGNTGSIDFPTKNPLQPANGGGTDAFVAKINGAGSALVYSTYLGGKGSDRGFGIAADSAGNAYITGDTNSTNFPTTPGSFQTVYRGGGEDAFVARLNPKGSVLVFSSYLGGSETCNGTRECGDTGWGIAVDSVGNSAYVAGGTGSTNFPTKNPLQPAFGGGYNDAFVAKMDVRAASTTALSSSPDSSTYGQAVTFTAVVTSTIGVPPDGETVTFMKGTKVLGTGTLSGGSASFTTPTLPAGTNYIKAVYGGDSNIAPNTSKAVSQVVKKATTTTTLTSSLNPSNFGQSVTFTASVTPQFSGTVHGYVTFYDGTTALKTVYMSGGVAKYATSTLTVGAHNITSTYNGNVDFDSSSASLTQTVN